MLTAPVLMLYYKSAGLSLGESFALKAVYSFIIVVSEVPSGYLADRLGRKKMLIGGTILGCLGYVFYAFQISFISFLLAEIVLGLGQSLISGTDSALLYDSLKERKQEQKYVKFEGWNYAVGNFAEVGAVLLGGFLAASSIRTPFVAQVFIAFIGIPAAIMLKDPVHRYRSGVLQSVSKAFVAVYTAIKENGPLLRVLVHSSLIGMSSLLMAWAFPLIADVHGLNFKQIGIVAAGLNLVLALTATFVFHIERKYSNKRLVWIFTLFFILGFLAAILPRFWMLLSMLVLFYFARGIAIPVLKNMIHVHTPSDMRATILSVRSLFVRILFVLIYPAVGFLGDFIGLPYAFTLYGIVLLLLSIISLAFLFDKAAS